MVAKLGQGPSNMMQMQGDSDLVSPSFLVAPGGGQSPAFPRDSRRRSSASSIIDDASLDSDSDEESGMALMTLNPRTRSDSVQTASSSQSSENKGRDVEPEEKEELVQQPSQTVLIPPPEEEPQEGAMAKPRLESLGKISRSSSAPEKEWPRVVDTSSLSRSSSAPQGPTPGQVLSLREGIIMKRRVEEQEGSESSSVSLNDSAGDSDMPSPSSQNISIDFPSLPPPESHETTDNRTELQSPDQQSNSELDSSSDQDTYQLSPSPDETISPSLDDNEHEHSEPDQELDENSLNESEEDTSLTAESKGNLPGQTPGFQVLQGLSDSLEPTMKGNEPVKQTPHIKSQLLAQHKIQSAITPAEQPRKRISLPRRSSPVVSRKSRPGVSKKGHDKADQDISGILQKIRDASSASSASTGECSPPGSLERGGKLGKLMKRSSDSFPRSPVKPDKSHYPVGLDLIETRDKREKSYGSFLGSRKKSMSLSDLLNIGKDLTSSRSKEKDNKRDESRSKPLEPLSPLSPSTDEDAVSPNDKNENKKEEKRSRFSRLRRKSSRTEMKDGIASGPNIDPKRASRHFFKESLMLESS